jgi:hypothetical protein
MISICNLFCIKVFAGNKFFAFCRQAQHNQEGPTPRKRVIVCDLRSMSRASYKSQLRHATRAPNKTCGNADDNGPGKHRAPAQHDQDKPANEQDDDFHFQTL